MLKTKFPGIERESSALGFGCMRLPTDADRENQRGRGHPYDPPRDRQRRPVY